ncbi:MAG TPA: DUF4422 domain-containing protein [Eubacteriales bacterium]|nr:DUF4422 domain-containing protein [Eubacteriales bacterium]
MKIQIAVAAHKPYWMPDDGAYLPLQVGSAGRETIPGFQRDDEGENISVKNASYCELTGLYWAWKHLDADYIGLVHYRRHFARPFTFGRKRRVAATKTFEHALSEKDALLPKKRRYVLETNYLQYIHAHHEQDLLLTKQILSERCADYLPDWERVMRKRSGHRFNMLVMKKELFGDYCAWLFGLLFELERRLDTSSYSGLNARVYGLVSERLLDVWLEHNGISYAELPVVHLESQHWPKKIARFLGRKLRRGK